MTTQQTGFDKMIAREAGLGALYATWKLCKPRDKYTEALRAKLNAIRSRIARAGG